MAEAVGLALGGIALTGLVSSCVDILEYTSNARYWMCDLSLALTKVALLQCRLEHLRERHLVVKAVSSVRSNDQPGTLGSALHCNTATQGLSGVQSVLQQTNRLCRRYSFAHAAEEGEHCWPAHRPQDLQSLSLMQDPNARQLALVASKPWQRLGRQICWALQDKKKFDKLILDLDFLLSNTEQLVERTSTCTSTAHHQKSWASISHTPLYTSKFSQMGDSDTTREQDFSSTTLGTLPDQQSPSPKVSTHSLKPTANISKRRGNAATLPSKSCEAAAFYREHLPQDSRMPEEESHDRDASHNTYRGNDTYRGNNMEEDCTISINTRDKHGIQGPANVSDNIMKTRSIIAVGDSDEVAKLRLELAKANGKKEDKSGPGN